MLTLKKTIIFGLLLLVGGNAYTFDLSDVRVGVRGGVNLNNAIDHPADPSQITGYCVGALFNYKLMGNLSLQLNLLATDRGFVMEDTTIGQVTYDSTIHAYDTTYFQGDVEQLYNYLELPLLLKYSVPATPKFHPYILGGPYLAFKFREIIRVSNAGVSIDIDSKLGRDIDYGFIGGAGMDIKFGKGWFFIEGRYDRSMRKTMLNGDYYLQSISFQAGYMF